MTDCSMALVEYLRKISAEADADFLCEAVQLLTQKVLEPHVEEQNGAKPYERTPARSNQRNGYRVRTWETRVGEIPLRFPELRSGSLFPSLLAPRRRSEKALLAVVQQAYIQGVSTRKVDDLLRALGLTDVDRSNVSRIFRELGAVVRQFRERPL